MDRIDKIIYRQAGYTRKEVKRILHKKRVEVNNQVIVDSDYKVDIEKDKITIDKEELQIKEYVYLILNKPKGYVSATKDNKDSTVLELVPEEYRHRDLFPAGRLDKDTTGLMLITDDGKFAHEILSPKKHVKKSYLVTIDQKMNDNMIEHFKKGILLKEGITKPAELEIIDEHTGIITLTEGKYHQIKRMFLKENSVVTDLKRIKMGNLSLPKDIEEGFCRECTEQEFKLIKE